MHLPEGGRDSLLAEITVGTKPGLISGHGAEMASESFIIIMGGFSFVNGSKIASTTATTKGTWIGSEGRKVQSRVPSHSAGWFALHFSQSYQSSRMMRIRVNKG